MWSRKQKVESQMVFRLPFGNGSLTFSEINIIYPSLASSMDGEDTSSCLSFYYSKNPVTSIYEFKDNDAEADIADFMEMDFITCSEGESLSESQERKRKEQLVLLEKARQNQPRKIKDPTSLDTMVKKLQNILDHIQKCANDDKKQKALITLRTQYNELISIHPESITNEIVQRAKCVL